MATSIVPFSFESQEVRVVVDDGTPWFNANDVCAALELANPRKAVADHVDDDDVTKRDTIDSLGRTQSVNHVNESGLYALILGSHKPEAKRFKRWVTSEVLPSIRKTGSYAIDSRSAGTALPGQVEDMLRGLRVLRDDLVADLGVDKGIAWAHLLKSADTKLGTDFHATLRPLLPSALDFREPTQLDQLLELGKVGRTSATNLLLQECGYQTRDAGGAWVPTDKAVQGKHWIRRPYSRNGHSGMSLLWEVSWVRSVVAEASAAA